VSDNHRRVNNFIKVYKKVAPIDLLIHCGDAEGSEESLIEVANCPYEIVSGNNDYYSLRRSSSLLPEEEFMIGRYRVWLVHGHRHMISMNSKTISHEAIRRNMDIVMCGHTHRPLIEISPQLVLLNPGSLEFPRQSCFRPSFIIMEIDRHDEAHYTIGYL
jgi:putative phosphoesterase